MVRLSALDMLQTGMYGLSVEQRKRLTIAVELVANPSIVFMDEPTSGAARSLQQITKSILALQEQSMDLARIVCCGVYWDSKAAQTDANFPVDAGRMAHLPFS
jgi:energy-coupling factor transporter ATP-binding protein EcfA2